MYVKLSNLGPIQQAEFALGDMTLICGSNNMGKTYATYALFGFLQTWRQMLKPEINHDDIVTLQADGIVCIDLSNYISNAGEILESGCQSYTKTLPHIFSAAEANFKSSKFEVFPELGNLSVSKPFNQKIGAANSALFSITKEEDSKELVVSLLVDKKNIQFPLDIISRIIADAINEIIFGQFFPKPFIASAERTGAAIFRKELNFARNRLLKEVSQDDKKFDPLKLVLNVYRDYALPVESNVDFTRELENLVKNTSFIAEKHREVLDDFSDIIGGEYNVTKNDELYFKPKSKGIKLTMDESSSAVRSLLDIGFYLRHVAKVGDILMVDEPELNLHPENQRKIARLFARLVNLDIHVFITTHSDYFVKELNTLIMLNQDKPYLRKIAKDESYRESELLSADNIKVYIAEKALIKRDGNQKKTQCQTLSPALIDSENGIEVRSFDKTINEMNRIQDAIIWGGNDS